MKTLLVNGKVVEKAIKEFHKHLKYALKRYVALSWPKIPPDPKFVTEFGKLIENAPFSVFRVIIINAKATDIFHYANFNL